MTGELRTHSQVEAEVRRLLGPARLVCEVEWPEDVLTAVRGCWAFMPHAPNKPAKAGEFVTAYPATGVLFLVQHGVRNYRENDYWTDLRLGTEQNRTGEAFERALRSLGLETFAQFRQPGEPPARRFVAPILAHGGIPASQAPDFLRDVLFPALRHGHGSTGADLVARWRRDPPTGLTRTVGRFLLHGGGTAVDLLDRIIALGSIPRADLAAGTAAGVPRHIVDAFLAVPASQVPRPRPVLPRPAVVLDPWGEAGPVLELPPVVRELGEGLVWVVEDGSGATRIERAYPRRDFTPVPLHPADQWRVTAKRGDEVVFERTYECFGDNEIVCFDDARAYVSDADGLRAEHAWVVAPRAITLASVEADGHRMLRGETADFYGAWSKYRGTRVDLRSVEILAAMEGDREASRVPVLHTATATPSFTTTALRDVRSQEGLDVRAALPEVRLPAGASWTVRLTTPAGASAVRVEDVGELPQTLALADLAGGQALGVYVVDAVGPLASDLHERFLLVPGLSVATPDAPVGPAAGEVPVAVACGPDVKFPGGGWGEPATVTVAPEEAQAELWAFARDHAGKAGMLVSIPRIRWAWRGTDSLPDFVTAKMAFRPEQLGTDMATLLVATGRPDVHVRVYLADAAGVRIVAADTAGRSNEGGRFAISLRGLEDSARADAHTGLQLILGVGEAKIAIATCAASPRAASAADAAGRTSLLGRQMSVTVTGVHGSMLEVDVEGSAGVLYAERLPKPITAYKVGDTVTAIVASIGDKLKMDARTFDATRFHLGEMVTAKVVRARGDDLLAIARGHDVEVPRERLPRDRPAVSWRAGEEVTGKVIYIDPGRRIIRLSAIPFETGAIKVGALVEGEVFHSADVLLLRVGDLVGYVPNGEMPARRPSMGESIRCRVTGIDDKKDQLVLSCRSFNPDGYRVGDRVRADVTWIRGTQAWVRLPGGESAWMPLDDPLDESRVTAVGVGGSIEVVIRDIDPAHSRIRATPAFDGAGLSFGDAAPDSPFANLKDPGRGP